MEAAFRLLHEDVGLFQRQFGFLELVILLLIVLSVLNTINLNLSERRGEFGTMRAIGNSNRQVFSLIMTEGLFLGIAGSLVGAVLGILLRRQYRSSASRCRLPRTQSSAISLGSSSIREVCWALC